MSLQVWLPLTGDLHNQGLSGISVSNHNATLNENGKLGACYYFNGNQQWLQFDSVLGNFYNNDWTVACWIKPTDSTRSVIISEYNGTGASNVAIELSSSRNVRLYWAGSPDIYFSTAGEVPLDTWTHVALSKQGRMVNLYFNGELKQTYTNSSDFSTRTSNCQPRIGDDYRGDSGNTVSYQGYINDFRMYDHCLSAEEIKKVSQGLILHYALNNRGMGQENLLRNTFDFYGSSSTSTTIITDNIDGTYAKTTPSTVDWTAIRIGPTISESLISGKTITVTCDVRAFDLPTSNTSNYCYLTLEAYISANTFNRIGNKDHSFSSSALKEDEWVTLSYQLDVNFSNWTIASGYTTSDCQYITLGLFNHSGKRIDFRHPKIELGSIATPWSPNPSDSIYTTLGLNSGIEYDQSGFGNNGTISGTLTPTSDTPKYNASKSFENGSFIRHKLPETMYQATYSFWVKSSSYASYGAIYIPEGTPTGGTSPWLSVNTEGRKVWGYIGGNSPHYTYGASGSISTDEWHHCVYVWDNGVAQWYLDGEASGSSTTYTARTYIQNTNNATIGNSYTGTTWSGTQFNGMLSDFRVYATALSASDIKSLYNNGAYIDESDNIYGEIRT